MARMVTRRDASRRKWIAELLMHDLVLILDHTDGKELGGESSNKMDFDRRRDGSSAELLPQILIENSLSRRISTSSEPSVNCRTS